MRVQGISLLFILVLFFSLSGCSKKSSNEENATMPVTEKRAAQENNRTSRSFILTDVDERELNITIEGSRVLSRDIDQSLILINFFATWCPPCRGELPDLSQLQRKQAKNLFIIGVLVNDEQNSTQLRHFMEKYGANYYISYAEANNELAALMIKALKLSENFPIPLSVLYKDGEFYRYYEGAMPIEMMENELKQALKRP
jgi:thiol-disulfide isomerase/thioredoxin